MDMVLFIGRVVFQRANRIINDRFWAWQHFLLFMPSIFARQHASLLFRTASNLEAVRLNGGSHGSTCWVECDFLCEDFNHFLLDS